MVYQKILFTVIFLLTLFSVSYSADWKYYGYTPDGTFYYDKENITYMPNNIIRVWTKRIYSDAGKDATIKQHGENFKDIESTSDLVQINCNEKKYSMLHVTHYTSKGVTIKDIDVTEDESFIPADSIIELLYQIVCEKTK